MTETFTPEFILPFNEVTRQNILQMKSEIISRISSASFVSLDTEFTGLGGSQFNTRNKNIDERYKALAQIASHYALVALGISVFELKNPDEANDSASTADLSDAEKKKRFEQKYDVHNYNLLLLRNDDYVVSKESMLFLFENGFDFGKQLKQGILYSTGLKESTDSRTALSNTILRDIFSRIIITKTPIVVHNGLLDLMFIYHSFYSDLPSNLESFSADLYEMFPAGIYDTKYIADYHTREGASYLAYLFRKYEREQQRRAKNLHDKTRRYLVCEAQDELKLDTSGSLGLWETPVPKKSKKMDEYNTGKPFCEQYAAHGTCFNGRKCPRTHDLDIILDYEEKRASGNLKYEDFDLSTNGDATATDSDKKRVREIEESDEKDIKKLKESSTAEMSNGVGNSGNDEDQGQTASKLSLEEGITYGTLFERFHSAWFDSYMTGYVFARQCLVENDKKRKEASNGSKATGEHSELEKSAQSHETILAEEIPDVFKNKLYLMGKQVPLSVVKSQFAKNSKGHLTRMKELNIKRVK
ncbi:Target of EGR1, member 1 (Nuclear) [Nowakowskiella sp. JEL0407]|nr:Target of EGR1, member 1 (Nuclear) [Nowakowskiella sp. JEL0407]